MIITLIRTALLYGLLILTVRLMGKRQVAEMEPAEFVVTMLLANLAAVPMQDNALPLISGLVPIFAILSLELMMAVGTIRLLPLRRLLCGRPTVLIRDGAIDQKALCLSRVSLEELLQKLREKDVFDLSTVQLAVLETDGELSVMPRPAHRPVTVGDCGLPAEETGPRFTVISNGVLVRHSLAEAGFDRAWLREQLLALGVRRRDVFMMTVDRSGSVQMVRKEKS